MEVIGVGVVEEVEMGSELGVEAVLTEGVEAEEVGVEGKMVGMRVQVWMLVVEEMARGHLVDMDIKGSVVVIIFLMEMMEDTSVEIQITTLQLTFR